MKIILYLAFILTPISAHADAIKPAEFGQLFDVTAVSHEYPVRAVLEKCATGVRTVCNYNAGDGITFMISGRGDTEEGLFYWDKAKRPGDAFLQVAVTGIAVIADAGLNDSMRTVSALIAGAKPIGSTGRAILHNVVFTFRYDDAFGFTLTATKGLKRP